jgi:ABC-type branched-subunit amino acid transport system substrate-binding protein
VLERDPFVEEIPEFEAYARRIAREEAGAVVFSGNAPDLLRMARELRGAGGSARLVATNPPTAEMLADSASAAALAGMRYTALYLPDRPLTEAARRFAPAFRERFGAAPDHWAALSYDAARVIGGAVHRAGADRRKVRDEVAKVGRDLPAHSGATGEIRFDQWGDPVEKPVLLAEVGR